MQEYHEVRADLKVQLYRGEMIPVLLNSKYKSLRDGLILSREEDLKNFLIFDSDQAVQVTDSDQVSESA